MSFEYLKRDSSISTILNPSSIPSCIAQLPTCADNSFNTSSSGIRCSAMLSIPIKADLFHQIFKYFFKIFDVTRLTRRVSQVEQELLTLSEHPSSPLVFSGVRVTRSLVLYVCFVDCCLSFCTFSFGHYFLLLYIVSNCPFGIFKLFFHNRLLVIRT